MSDITNDDVKHVAHLARLAITDEEAEKFTKQLSKIIHYADLLNELDTDDIEPTTHVLETKNVLRKDEPKQWITQDEALKNAPDKKDGHFRVPSVME
ncbi:Asp-tRNA(Asn)/Glu-tRNA(Gln) amidotransferase subunit GatC [Virgibacillus necropolis]|uniref:Aspartyl/glutamyl-tRNA(Asn/Gln) amidotransferase subunit C n=1 Tax=Virgibacillus necropolis TaxID=163877 RepID=A0A221MHA2_9BACI|nr:Asp-tRNA(Asn)/Glu-tRNA(Gln) amidotransferase subunit GatC [Virgibacillus necropolis]ASN06992.1 Asp-tRNA(Asn)/Glu-tRNA(Gln) amidotransferase GatCAB subunit C [Virgibacillus necropolis]